MYFQSLCSYKKATNIIAKNKKSTKVIILGSHAGMGILALPESHRNCKIIAVVDDYRIKEASTYFNIRLITSKEFLALTMQQGDIIAINTCETKKPKKYFNNLCKQANVACITNWQAMMALKIYKNDEGEYHPHPILMAWKFKLLNIGDWLISHSLSSKETSNGIVMVRLDGAGDFFLWLHAAKYIREHYTGQKITLFCNSAWASYAQTLPYWDIVVPVKYKEFAENLSYRWKIMLRMRWGRFSIAIQPTYFRVLIQGDSLIRASVAPKRIGWHGGGIDRLRVTGTPTAQYERSDRWYTHLLKSPVPIRPEIERDAEFASLLTHQKLDPQITILSHQSNHDVSINSSYCILFPGASWHGRRWPAQHFIALANKITDQFGWHIVLGGSLDERETCNFIAAGISTPVTNMAGKTSWVELIELIRNAEVLISNETSAIHIAPMVDTPSVCILGGGHYGMFVPYPHNLPGTKPLAATQKMECYGCGWLCTQPRDPDGPVPCIQNISVDHVLENIHKAINQNTDHAIAQPIELTTIFNVPVASEFTTL